MTRQTDQQLIVETLALRSGTKHLARDVATLIHHIHGRHVSAKSVSKNITLLEDQYPLLNRKETTRHEKNIYNCRYTYLWGKYEE